jgi:hypothetical protein
MACSGCDRLGLLWPVQVKQGMQEALKETDEGFDTS